MKAPRVIETCLNSSVNHVSSAHNAQALCRLTHGPAFSIVKRVDITYGLTETFTSPSNGYDAQGNDDETWQIRLQMTESMLPVALVTGWMRRFYVFAEDAVFPFIGRDLNVEDFTLRLGQVTLEFFCRANICWNIMAEFLQVMQRLTSNGFVGLYEGHIVNVATGLTTWVKLTIRPPRIPPA